MEPTIADRLRGMFLLSAYGDAFGAGHEISSAIHPSPFPERLPTQNIGVSASRWGYWVTQAEVGPTAKGIPTDDTAYKLFILHPWLRSVLAGDSSFDENSFIQFISELRSTPVSPAIFVQPRNAQIDNWKLMYDAADALPPRIKDFFKPNVPVVFGFFLFLEAAAFRTRYQPVENYLYFREATRLDQGYAKSATGFLTSIVSQAFSSNPVQQRFDGWFVQESANLISALKTASIDVQDVSTIERILETMSELGDSLRGSSPHEFMVSFEQAVVVPNQPPPFMDEPFKWPEHDPFRMLAEMIAATVYAEGDPHRAIQVLAFSSGDSDTVCTFLGTLMGIWFGEESLLQNANLTDDLTTVERVLTTVFEINLEELIHTFRSLRGESNIDFLA